MTDHLNGIQIANLCGVTLRTVLRWRERDGMPWPITAACVADWLELRTYMLPPALRAQAIRNLRDFSVSSVPSVVNS